jgi:hypothetical protein
MLNGPSFFVFRLPVLVFDISETLSFNHNSIIIQRHSYQYPYHR